jgi:hypothetical protein
MNRYISLYVVFHPYFPSLSLQLCHWEVNCDGIQINYLNYDYFFHIKQ